MKLKSAEVACVIIIGMIILQFIIQNCILHVHHVHVHAKKKSEESNVKCCCTSRKCQGNAFAKVRESEVLYFRDN